MKILKQILKFLVIAGLTLTIIAWLMAHGSGHKIPFKTDLIFGLLFLLFSGFTWIIFTLSTRQKK